MTDRDRLIELHHEAGVEWDNYLFECLDNEKVPSKTYDEFHADHLLANDVVKVVRCKDCKHYCLSDFRKPNEPKWCELSQEQNEYPNPNDFCSYGELKECEG